MNTNTIATQLQAMIDQACALPGRRTLMGSINAGLIRAGVEGATAMSRFSGQGRVVKGGAKLSVTWAATGPVAVDGTDVEPSELGAVIADWLANN